MKVDPNNSPNRFSSWMRVTVRVWVGVFQLGYGLGRGLHKGRKVALTIPELVLLPVKHVTTQCRFRTVVIRTAVALFSHRCRIALLAFTLLTFALLSLRTVDPFALLTFALLTFALLASHWCRSHCCLSHSCRTSDQTVLGSNPAVSLDKALYSHCPKEKPSH